MTNPNYITHDRLKEMLHYCPESGIFTWRKSPHGKFPVGSPAGCKQRKGYWGIKVDKILYRRSRLAWFYMTGNWPIDQIDHINNERSDDIFSNLRECTNTQNQWNTTAKITNKLGIKGVHLNKKLGKYVADIRVAGKNKHIGCYATIEEAIAARNAAAMFLHGEFATISKMTV